MKKGTILQVSEEYDQDYPGQEMKWTEECTGRNKAYKGVLFHLSYYTLLKGFLPKKTCFFEDIRGSGYVYALKYEGRTDQYCDEHRIELEEGMSLVYVGKVARRCTYPRGKKNMPKIVYANYLLPEYKKYT